MSESRIPIEYLDEIDDQEKKRSHTPDEYEVYLRGQRRGFCKGYRKAEHDLKEKVLKNFREVCGCYHAGNCTVDCKECVFANCETLTDLLNE